MKERCKKFRHRGARALAATGGRRAAIVAIGGAAVGDGRRNGVTVAGDIPARFGAFRRAPEPIFPKRATVGIPG